MMIAFLWSELGVDTESHLAVVIGSEMLRGVLNDCSGLVFVSTTSHITTQLLGDYLSAHRWHSLWLHRSWAAAKDKKWRAGGGVDGEGLLWDVLLATPTIIMDPINCESASYKLCNWNCVWLYAPNIACFVTYALFERLTQFDVNELRGILLVII